MSDLHVFNRYIASEFGDEIPPCGIFGKAPDDLGHQVAEWAGELLAEVYRNRGSTNGSFE